MRTFYRHFLWLKSLSGWGHPVVVVFDEVESTRSSFRKTYLLHTTNQPSVNGTLLSATSGSGMLYQRTVFPRSPDIELVGGRGKEYWVDGRNYPPSKAPSAAHEAGSWRAEISPSAARTHDEFLHMLYATEAGSRAPPAVRAVDGDSMKGVETQNLVILFATKFHSVSRVAYSTSAARRNLLFGVAPSRYYEVAVNGSVIVRQQATVDGTLDFQTPVGGTVEVVLK
jgi:hypothetical protein